MKPLAKIGLIVAVLLFLITLVGFELHQLGEYSKVQPDTTALQQAVISASIFSIIQLLIFLYLIYLDIVVLIKLYKIYIIQAEKDKELEHNLNKLLEKFKNSMEEKKTAVDNVDFPITQPDITKEDLFAKKIVKPLYDNYNNTDEYLLDVLMYYKQLGGEQLEIAQELIRARVFITDVRTLENIVNICSNNLKIISSVVRNVILESFCTEEVKKQYEESIKSKN